MNRIVEVLGIPPRQMLENAQPHKVRKLFEKDANTGEWRVKKNQDKQVGFYHCKIFQFVFF